MVGWWKVFFNLIINYLSAVCQQKSQPPVSFMSDQMHSLFLGAKSELSIKHALWWVCIGSQEAWLGESKALIIPALPVWWTIWTRLFHSGLGPGLQLFMYSFIRGHVEAANVQDIWDQSWRIIKNNVFILTVLFNGWWVLVFLGSQEP